MMRWILLFAALLGCWPAPGQPVAIPPRATAPMGGDSVEFLTGDIMYGRLAGWQLGQLRWQHEGTGQTFIINPAGIYRVRMAATNTPPAAAGDCLVRLVNGDELRGKLAGLDEQTLTLSTWYAGDLRLQRASLQSLVTGLTRFKVLHEGPFSMEGWVATASVRTDTRVIVINGVVQVQPVEANPGNLANGWHYHNGAFYGINAGTLGRNLGLPPVSNLEFDLAWRGNLYCSIAFYTDNLANTAANTYVLQLSYRSAHLRRNTPTGQSVALGSVELPEGTNRVRVALRTDLPNKTVTLFLNDQMARQWVDISNLDGLGGGLAMQLMGGYQTVKISNLRATEWDGRLDTLPPVTRAKEEDLVRLVNQDKVSGRLVKIAHNLLHLQTAFGALELPLERITGVDFATPPDAPPPGASPATGLVRASFRTGGRVTLRIEHWDYRQLAASSPHFDRAVFATGAFQSLQFNLHQARFDADSHEAPSRWQVSPEILLDEF